MITVALKGLLGRKLRALLTAISIVLGVAMISGTYVLTDTIKAAFSTVFTEVYQNTDAAITGKSAIGGNARKKLIMGSATVRAGRYQPNRKPTGTAAVIPKATPKKTRRVDAKTSYSRPSCSRSSTNLAAT